MIKIKKKYIFLSILFSPLLFILWCGLYYLLVPVQDLNDHYPVFKGYSEDMDLKFELEEKEPKTWARISQISRYGVSAIRLSEDWAFYQHDGFDYKQLNIVLEESWKEKRLIRGASTISQQVVKNVFLSNERSLFRKFKEILLTLKLERNLKKKKILEVYLNIIELGKGVVGIKQGSLHYFRKGPGSLSPREAAFLAMLLPNPRAYSVSHRRGELTRFAEKRVREIMRKLQQARVLDEDQRGESLVENFTWEKNKKIEETVSASLSDTSSVVEELVPSATVSGEDTHTPQSLPHSTDSEI